MASGSVISVDVQIILLVTADPLKQRAVAVGIVLENNQMLRLYNSEDNQDGSQLALQALYSDSG